MKTRFKKVLVVFTAIFSAHLMQAQGTGDFVFQFKSEKSGKYWTGCSCENVSILDRVMAPKVMCYMWLPAKAFTFDRLLFETCDSLGKEVVYSAGTLDKNEFYMVKGNGGSIQVPMPYKCFKNKPNKLTIRISGNMIIETTKKIEANGTISNVYTYGEYRILCTSKPFYVSVIGKPLPENMVSEESFVSPSGTWLVDEKLNDINVKGWNRLMEKDYSGAMDMFNKALNINPDYVYAICNKAHAYLLLGDKANAMAIYKKYLGKRVDENVSWDQSIIADFKEFESKGIGSKELFNGVLKELELK